MNKARRLQIYLLTISLGTTFLGPCSLSLHGSVQTAVHGDIALVNADGIALVPEPATVYLVYCGHQKTESDTAGYAYLAETTKVAELIAEQTRSEKAKIATESKEQRFDELEKYELHTVDEGLKTAGAWSLKHHQGWQFTAVKVAHDGSWSQQKVTPGHYRVIARGRVGNLDAEWETDLDIKPGEMIPISLKTIRIGRTIKP